jgi:hypothetical protein
VSQQCQTCGKYQKVDEAHGDCVQKQTDVKGGHFQSARPVLSENQACPDFVARDQAVK